MKLKQYVKEIEPAKVLAARVKTSPSQMSHWVTGRKAVPIPKCVDIERETNGMVRRQDTCPQWRKIWPELVQTRPRPAVV